MFSFIHLFVFIPKKVLKQVSEKERREREKKEKREKMESEVGSDFKDFVDTIRAITVRYLLLTGSRETTGIGASV